MVVAQGKLPKELRFAFCVLGMLWGQGIIAGSSLTLVERGLFESNASSSKAVLRSARRRGEYGTSALSFICSEDNDVSICKVRE
jgi:hypothetical protein